MPPRPSGRSGSGYGALTAPRPAGWPGRCPRRHPSDPWPPRPQHAGGVRDSTIILLGYASAMRRSELVALTLLDVETKSDGLLVTVRRSKTDQEAHGQIVAVARGRLPETDPVAALAAWRSLCGHHPGPLFARLFPSRISLRPLSGDAIARMLRTRAHDAGLDPPGSPPTLYAPGTPPPPSSGGVPLARIAAQTRHKHLSVLVNRYIRLLEALATTSSRDLGL